MCNCPLCKEYRDILSMIKKKDVTKLTRKVNSLWCRILDMGEDLEYKTLVLNGTWSSSVEQLERALSNARKIREEKERKENED